MITMTLARPSAAYTYEIGRVGRHNARAMSWSFAAHAALLLWLLLHQSVAEKLPPLVEIAWLEPEPVQIASAPPPASAPVVEESAPVQKIPVPEQKFERLVRQADVEPAPQHPDALDDQLSDKLDALQNSLRNTRPDLAVTAKSDVRTRPTMATAPSKVTSPSSLVRSDAPDTKVPPAELTRSTTRSSRPTLAVAPKEDNTQRAPAMATPDENSARKTLDGAQLVGPVADRAVLSHRLPTYPAWAMKEAVEATVTLYFVVLPDGRVKDNVLVQKTSGHADFDRNAQEALRAWRFEELPGAGEQWGTITFHFKLRDH